MKRIIAAATAALCVTAGCARSAEKKNTVVQIAAPQDELVLPTVPSGLTAPEDRADYVLAHFWDNMDFSDTTRSRSVAFMEQNFANFASLFGIARIGEVLPGAAKKLMERAQVDRDAYNLLAETADKYLYNSNSPMLDEEAYIPFLEAIVNGGFIDEALKARYENQLEGCLKNRPGTPANDFKMILRDGKVSTLMKECRGGSRAILLLFYDPDCGNCARLVSEMEHDPYLADAITAKRVRVIAVYPDGIDEEWQAAAGHIPATWVDAMSPGGQVSEEEVYSLRAMPTLYLLDGDGKVVMKDAEAADAVPAALRM